MREYEREHVGESMLISFTESAKEYIQPCHSSTEAFEGGWTARICLYKSVLTHQSAQPPPLMFQAFTKPSSENDFKLLCLSLDLHLGN